MRMQLPDTFTDLVTAWFPDPVTDKVLNIRLYIRWILHSIFGYTNIHMGRNTYIRWIHFCILTIMWIFAYANLDIHACNTAVTGASPIGIWNSCFGSNSIFFSKNKFNGKFIFLSCGLKKLNRDVVRWSTKWKSEVEKKKWSSNVWRLNSNV